VVDVDLLVKELDAVRRRGYATDDGEYVPGCRCVAVPVGTSRDGSVVVALSITMPSSRTDDTWPDSLVEPLTRAANAMKPYVIAS
jgi:DNA-binding IclR family transcriptional regulator